jgi:hypothetical protein
MLELTLAFLSLSGAVLATHVLVNGGRTPTWATYPIFALVLVAETALLSAFLLGIW